MAKSVAAVESEDDNASCYETVNENGLAVTLRRETECYRFRSFDLFYYLISISFFFIDIATDSIVFVAYFFQGQFVWGSFALSFTIIPAAVIQMFSLRWHHNDGSIKNVHWLLHFLFLGVLYRYLTLLYSTIHSLRSKRFVKDKDWVYRQESDVCMLHLFESFLGAAPQLTLQLYVMAVLQRIPVWTSLSAVVAFCSLSWAIGTYTKATQKINPGRNGESTWMVLGLQAVWRAGTLTSRIAVLVLTAISLREWSLLFLGLHWLSMTAWVILHNEDTEFCPSSWEERVYNCIVGFIYCFDFFNLRVARSRHKILLFYSVIVTENIASLTVYVLRFKGAIRVKDLAMTTGLIAGGMTIGLTSMLFYYAKFHSSKSIADEGMARRSTETVISDAPVVAPETVERSVDTADAHGSVFEDAAAAATAAATDEKFLSTSEIGRIPEYADTGVVSRTRRIEDERASSTLAPTTTTAATTTSVRIVSERVVESAQSNARDENAPSLRGLPSDDGREYAEAAKDERTDGGEKDVVRRPKPMTDDEDEEGATTARPKRDCSPSQKRRAICFSSHLILEMEDDRSDRPIAPTTASTNVTATSAGEAKNAATREESESESEERFVGDRKILKAFNDVASAGTGESKSRMIFNDSYDTVGNMDSCETDGSSKESQQRDETMSCVASIHDYENVCPLGVARPPWCIRSWKGYTDIETYIHDDSVIRDRRRDTLTSTTTGTSCSYGSEFSDATCVSGSMFKGIVTKQLLQQQQQQQQDYLEALAYDPIDPRELQRTRTRSAAMYDDHDDARRRGISGEAEERRSGRYVARPVTMDTTAGTDVALDTIVEERDAEVLPESKYERADDARKRNDHDSVSTLVSTIDQIRKYTVENSPRHVYYTTGSQWEDFDAKSLTERRTRPTKAAAVLFENEENEFADVGGTRAYAVRRAMPGNFVESEKSRTREKREIDAIKDFVKYCAVESIEKTPLIDAILSDSPILGTDKTKLRPAKKRVLVPAAPLSPLSPQPVSKDNDLYVEMNPLVSVENVMIVRDDLSETANAEGNAGQSSHVVPTTKDSTSTFTSNANFDRGTEQPEKRVKKQPDCSRRRFCLLKEKFESKSQLVYVVTPKNAVKAERRSQEPSSKCGASREDVVFADPNKCRSERTRRDKENLAPVASPRTNANDGSRSIRRDLRSKRGNDESSRDIGTCFNSKEKRHLFLGQVLSPPKLLIWKRRGGSAAIVKNV
ncbi:uncharacterized protein LOC108631200 isoform X2 [Ceratina calcarata]|uniref:XK-related protein n=3 Tax=Ceratina calcarata TaxID=156304 RepID=A0AAJ7JCX1_9HYME|nr:uncharacterized protein LOC108631200 isoform X2 [Ceratina calcarata]